MKRAARLTSAVPIQFTVEPAHSSEGVDLTLIRWMLSLSPLERLEVLQTTLRSIGRLRGEAAED